MSERRYTIGELLFGQSDADKYVDALLLERVREKMDALFLEETLRWEREIILGTGTSEPKGLLNWTGEVHR